MWHYLSGGWLLKSNNYGVYRKLVLTGSKTDDFYDEYHQDRANNVGDIDIRDNDSEGGGQDHDRGGGHQ